MVEGKSCCCSSELHVGKQRIMSGGSAESWKRLIALNFERSAAQRRGHIRDECVLGEDGVEQLGRDFIYVLVGKQ